MEPSKGEAMMERLLDQAFASWEKRSHSILASYDAKVDANIAASEDRTLAKTRVLEQSF